jgi:hypothetical protein
MAGVALLDAEDEQSDDALRAEAEAAGIDFDAWAAGMRAKVAAYGAAERGVGANDVKPPAPRSRAREGKARWSLVMGVVTVGVVGLATLALRWAAPREAPIVRKYLPPHAVTEESVPSAAVPRPAPPAPRADPGSRHRD